MMNKDSKQFGQGKNLEDAFFLKEDEKLIQKLREMKKMEDSKSALAAASGINNEVVLKKLMELGIHAETVAALAVVPLVEVAWADGSVKQPEKEAVLKAVDQSGEVSEIVHELLESWLTRRPDASLLEAWSHYVEGLCEELTESEKEAFKQDLLGRARTVAEAYGGFLGFGKTSRAEEKILVRLEQAFR
jgi:hypothetical protein